MTNPEFIYQVLDIIQEEANDEAKIECFDGSEVNEYV